MLKILQNASKQPDLPMDVTGFTNDPIADSKLAVVTKMEAGKLAATSATGATLALEHATPASAIQPVGWIINDAGGFEYYNKAGMASKRVPIVPLAEGTLIETDQFVGLISTFTEGVAVYVSAASATAGQITATETSGGGVGAVGVVIDQDQATDGFVRVMVL